MSSSIYNIFNSSLPNMFGDPANFIKEFNIFKQSLGSNPEQYAQNLVNQMLSSGKIPQQQLNIASQMASMIQKDLNLY